MINNLQKRNGRRRRRMLHVRKGVRGSAVKPRLTVFKSNKHISVQLIDDDKGITIGSAGTLSKGLREKKFGSKSKEAARHVGAMIAEIAKKNHILTVVFDRGYNKFHGLLAEVANGAREAGLQF